jgi:hypothetical protein
MNIFYLDDEPATCATYHTDKHVIKMILESAQLLCTALNVTADYQVTPYKTTHVNHPCAIWIRASFPNWLYTYDLMHELEKEWQYRYNHTKRHASIISLHTYDTPLSIKELASMLLPNIGRTTPALAMPDWCKVPGEGNEVESYRTYYREAKKELHSWTKRGAPSWLSLPSL